MVSGVAAIFGVVTLVAMVVLGIALTWAGLRDDIEAHEIDEPGDET